MKIQRPSSSCFYDWTYDVFLNFRGKDTRTGFAGSLYNTLRESGIHTFFDDEAIQRGEEISPSLFKAIKESRMAITVFSPDYASSKACLDELVHILKYIKGQGRLVWTVFYHVDPSQLKDPEGIYKEQLARHEEKYGKEKIQTWRRALSEAARLAGLEINEGIGYEYDYIKKIIKDISTKINRIPLHVTDHPVGLESRVQDVNSLLEVGSNEGVHMVGIWGIGGVGKTTIARAVYNLIADKFDIQCFFSNVRDIFNKHGLSHLQETLLAKLVGEKDVKLGDVNEGASLIEHRLRKKLVLLVLDDVNDRKQLNAMAGKCNWFGRGSRIIITTRDEGLLKDHEVDRIYTVKQLNYEEALQLFSWKAFGKDEVDPSYLEISNRVVHYSYGLPLALEVIGSNFHHSKQNEWISLLDGYNKAPDIKIFEVLKSTYDQLGYSERQIFLDVACFFNRKRLGYVKDTLLKVRHIKSEYHIGELIRKSLIKVEYGRIRMHDLVQDMGKEIIRQESDIEPGGRSRLWFYRDILHVLQENTGTDKIEVLILDLPKGKKEVQWNEKAFEKMKNLKMLIIKNAYFTSGPTHLPNSLRLMDWSHYPGNALPSDFRPTNRFSLDLPESSLVSLGSLITKNMENLTTMNFSGCKFLTEVTDLSGAPNLEKLNLDFCPSLIQIHDSVGFLSKLRVLSARFCVNLITLPHGMNLTSLEFLQFYGCSRLQSFPEVLGKMEKTVDIELQLTAIEKLPYSIQNITGLRRLTLLGCQDLKKFPASLLQLPKLSLVAASNFTMSPDAISWKAEEGKGMSSIESSSSNVELDFRMCNVSYESISLFLSWLPKLRRLDLSYGTITILPICIKECHHLKELYVNNCEELQQIEGMPPNLEFLEAENCLSLTFQSSSMLMHQAFCGPGRRHFFLPGQEAPQWFHRYRDGYSTEFWVRKEFPVLVVFYAVIATTDDIRQSNLISLHVNGYLTWINSVRRGILCPLKGNHIFLSHVRQDDFLKNAFQRAFLPEQWNHVEIFGNDNGTIKPIGVHVYEQENVQFSRPNPSKKTRHHQSYVNKDSNSMALASASDAIRDRGATTLDYPAMSKPEDEVTKLSLNTHESTIAEMRAASSIGIGRHRNNGRIRYAVFLGGFAIVLFVVTMCMSLASHSRGHDCHVNLVPT